MKRSYRNVAFLSELMINIFVFSISCAILAGLFGKAGNMARQTREEGFASTELQTLVQIVKLRGPEGIPDAVHQQDETNCYYDKEWNAVTPGHEDAVYRVRLGFDPQQKEMGQLMYIDGLVEEMSTGRELCRMNTAFYHPVEGGGELS